MATVDWTNPCAKATALRNAYYALISGGQEQEIRTRTLDAEEVVRFYPADTDKLLAELTAAEADCRRASGAPDPDRRFTITSGMLFGGRRRWR